MAQARASLSTLPPEIFSRIIWMLRKEKDLVGVWTKTRNISHAFRHAVDSMVQKHHLPTIVLTFDIGENWDEETGSVSGVIPMSFQHLADDGPTRACFGQSDMDEGFVATAREGLNDLFAEPIGWICPKPTVLVRTIINDTEIPEFEWYPANLGVSCNWRGLLTALLLEERLCETKIHAWSEATGLASAEKLKPQMNAGKIDMETAVMAAGRGFAEAEKNAYRDARRQRIARQYIRDGIEPPSGPPLDEKRAINALKEARFMVGFKDFSDDEEEETEPIPKDDEDDELKEDISEQFEDVEGNGDADTCSEHEGSGAEAMDAGSEATDNEAYTHGLASRTA